MERLWPALEHVDSSSGALGPAVANALDVLVPMIIAAPADDAVRNKWMDRLWKAIEEDGVDYLSPVADRWGEIVIRAPISCYHFSPLVHWTHYQYGSGMRAAQPAAAGHPWYQNV